MLKSLIKTCISLFPITKKDLVRLLPLFMMCFFLSLNYYILKTLKDAVVITADKSGAEAIPFVKVWLLLPASIFFAVAFTWLANRYSLKTVFYIVMSGFLGFYAFFTFFLYPWQETFHLHALADWLETVLPAGWFGFTAVVRYWIFAVFYVMAECWSTIVYSVLFWGLANEITSVKDSEKDYPYLILAGNFSAVAAGTITIALSTHTLTLPLISHLAAWEQSLILLTSVVLFCGIASMILFRWAYEPELKEKAEKQLQSQESSAPHLTFTQAVAFLLRSKFLLSIAILVFAFNMVVNLAEVEWKNQIVAIMPTPLDYNIYMSNITRWIGWISAIFTVVLCTPSLRYLGWTPTALFTPVITLITAFFFFSALLVDSLPSSWAYYFLAPPTTVAFLGSLHICLSRSAKYTLFDITKEMAFIPLPSDEKLKGKAAVDGVGSRLGKSASSIVYQFLLILLPSVSACTPYVAVLIVAALICCLGAVFILGNLFAAEKKKLALQNLAL